MQSKETNTKPRSTNLSLPSVSQFSLDNGVSGLFVDIPRVSATYFEACFRAGDYWCPKDKPDLAHFLEHLVLMANEDYPGHKDFARAVQIHGSFFNAHTGSINVTYEFEAPDSAWSETLDLLLTAISKPLFLSAEFESEKNVVRQEHKGYIDDPQRRSIELALHQVGYPFALSDKRLECLDSITPDDVRDYYQQTHTLSNLRFIIVGNLPPDRRGSIKQKLAGLDLPSGDGLRQLPKIPFRGAGIAHESRAEIEMVGYFLYFANPGLVLTPQEDVAARLLYGLLMLGDDSWVWGRGRAAGLIYELGCYWGPVGDSTNLDFSGQMIPENIEPLTDIILAAIDRLAAGDLSVDDVEYHKSHAIGSHQRLSLTPQFWVSYFRDNYIDRDIVLSPDYRSLVEAVDKDQIIAVAQKLLGGCDWSLGLLGEVSDEIKKRVESKVNGHKGR